MAPVARREWLVARKMWLPTSSRLPETHLCPEVRLVLLIQAHAVHLFFVLFSCDASEIHEINRKDAQPAESLSRRCGHMKSAQEVTSEQNSLSRILCFCRAMKLVPPAGFGGGRRVARVCQCQFGGTLL